ncbi:MAG TPA: VWA domain-containing protein, partial [Pirellulaceae bacterium]|nr:VWA domain-containing protein [Pirellulaceae bacterium]
ISSVVHLIALLTLALCTYAELRPLEPQTLHANLAPATALEELEALTIAAPLEQAESVAAEMPTSEAMLASDVTELPSTMAGHSSAITTDADAVQVGEIGELFSEAGQGLSEVAGNGGSAEFFGVKAGGRKFVFIVDSSNSMRGRKFSEAKRELLYAVKQLDKQQMFYVIFFDRDAECMFSAPGREPEPRPLPATGENIRRLDKWLPLVENEGRTDPYDAVKIALALHPDAIFLLSDGQFTDGGRTEIYLAEKNLFDDPLEGKRRPLVTVHTIAFYSQDGEVTMKAIAKAYNGTYRFVSKP